MKNYKKYKLPKDISKKTIQIDNKIYLWEDVEKIYDKETGEIISIQECRNRWKKLKQKWKDKGWIINYDSFYEFFSMIYKGDK